MVRRKKEREKENETTIKDVMEDKSTGPLTPKQKEIIDYYTKSIMSQSNNALNNAFNREYLETFTDTLATKIARILNWNQIERPPTQPEPPQPPQPMHGIQIHGIQIHGIVADLRMLRAKLEDTDKRVLELEKESAGTKDRMGKLAEMVFEDITEHARRDIAESKKGISDPRRLH